jgi:hypothetical protein
MIFFLDDSQRISNDDDDRYTKKPVSKKGHQHFLISCELPDNILQIGPLCELEKVCLHFFLNENRVELKNCSDSVCILQQLSVQDLFTFLLLLPIRDSRQELRPA